MSNLKNFPKVLILFLLTNFNSLWCIAITGKATLVATWEGSGNGKNIWNDFTDDGALTGKSLSKKSKMPSGALCVSVELKV